MTSSQTVQRLRSSITGPGDLPGKKVATAPGTIPADYLTQRRISFVEVTNAADAIDPLTRGEVQAVVFDAPVLRQIQPEASSALIEAHAAQIIAAAQQDDSVSHGFCSARHRVPILLALLIAFFNQLSGVNAVLYFAPRIFELTGLGAQAALLQSIGIGITNLVFTFAGLWLMDRLGRRTLLIIGSFGYIASLGLCAWAFFTGHFSVVPACIFAFIAAHAIGQGAVIWVFISEIFPDRCRAAGQSLGSATHWVFAALLTTFFPAMVGAFPPGWVFLFFPAMMVVQLVWVKMMVPETKGVPLEDIQQQLGISS